MKKMNEKKFLQQMYGKLENQLEQEVKLADDSIEILDGDKAIFKIDSKGDVLYSWVFLRFCVNSKMII